MDDIMRDMDNIINDFHGKKAAAAARMRAYREANREKINEDRRKWREANKDKEKERNRRYRESRRKQDI